MMQKNYFLCLLIGVFIFGARKVQAQASEKIHTIEYFFNVDPGFGNGLQISVSPASQNVAGLLFTPDIAGLPRGLHTLYVRGNDSLYRWSHSTPKMFFKETVVTSLAANVTNAEYFFDTDPGFGNGIVAAVTAGGTVTFPISGNIAALTTGLHLLYVRVKDALGNWSETTPSVFYREAIVNNIIANVVAAEYFFDTDPGFGNATAVTVVAGQMVTFGIAGNIAALSNGLHYLYVRTLAADGKWSITTSQLFYKEPPVSSTIPNVVGAEYFFDTDPGFGNGTPYVFPVQGTIVNQMISVSTTGLTKGFHRFYMRAKDANGNWSLINAPVFYYETIVPTPGLNSLTSLEWFWNTDPGFGNGNQVSLPAGNNGAVTGFAFNVSGITTFSNTRQNLFIRTTDGNWSHTTVRMVDFTGVVLPVTLLEFSAKGLTNSVITNWTTSQETNTDKFEVEHSADGIHFLTFGTLAAAGNSSVDRHYQLEHFKPVTGVNFYRLKQFDRDGKFTYSAVVKIIFNGGKSGPLAFPNPVQEKLTVMVPNALFSGKKSVLTIFDSKGAVIFTGGVTTVTNQIDFSRYAAGNYFIMLKDESGKTVWQEKIMKVK